MPVDDPKVIDLVSVPKGEPGPAIVYIVDHLPWGDLESDHLVMLQTKMQRCLDFIESGQLVRDFPTAKGRSVMITISAIYPLSQQARNLLDWTTKYVRELGFDLSFERISADS